MKTLDISNISLKPLKCGVLMPVHSNIMPSPDASAESSSKPSLAHHVKVARWLRPTISKLPLAVLVGSVPNVPPTPATVAAGESGSMRFSVSAVPPMPESSVRAMTNSPATSAGVASDPRMMWARWTRTPVPPVRLIIGRPVPAAVWCTAV
jgi:hypothetical protein